jgi:hypothetical protein
MANAFWNQSYLETLQETVPCLVWISFFFLLRFKIPIKTIERIVLFYGVVYVILYFYQLSQSPTVLFGKSLWGDEFTIDRGITRIIFPGAGIFILAVFISINKLTTQIKHRWFFLLFSFFGILIPILQVTRQFILGVALIYLYHFLKTKNIVWKFATVSCLLFLYFYIPTIDNDIIKGLTEAAESDMEKGEDYIRVQAGQYFLFDFSPSNVNKVFGNGAPSWGNSYYGIYVENLAMFQGFYMSDVGIIGMYSMFGIFSVIAFFIIWYKAYAYKVPPAYYYVKYYLAYLLFTCFTWFTIYHYHYIISTVFALYIYTEIVTREQEVDIDVESSLPST